MFRVGEEASKYSEYDERGIPTHLANGDEVSKKQRKKLEKLYEARVRACEKVAILEFLISWKKKKKFLFF